MDEKSFIGNLPASVRLKVLESLRQQTTDSDDVDVGDNNDRQSSDVNTYICATPCSANGKSLDYLNDILFRSQWNSTTITMSPEGSKVGNIAISKPFPSAFLNDLLTKGFYIWDDFLPRDVFEGCSDYLCTL